MLLIPQIDFFIEDNITNFQGPLAGFAKAMEVAKTPYLLVLPCDCPVFM
jgi:molybdopterin-guanine dinucleotide biosynthesis protein A